MAKLSTDPYKGVRDFYPEDQYIQKSLSTGNEYTTSAEKIAKQLFSSLG